MGQRIDQFREDLRQMSVALSCEFLLARQLQSRIPPGNWRDTGRIPTG
jgi:hypothetical protein